MEMTFTWQGASEAEQLLARLEQPDFEPLMETWARVLVEDNRAGVLSGIDRHDRPVALVSPEWRPTCNPVPTPPRIGNLPKVDCLSSGPFVVPSA